MYFWYFKQFYTGYSWKTRWTKNGIRKKSSWILERTWRRTPPYGDPQKTTTPWTYSKNSNVMTFILKRNVNLCTDQDRRPQNAHSPFILFFTSEFVRNCKRNVFRVNHDALQKLPTLDDNTHLQNFLATIDMKCVNRFAHQQITLTKAKEISLCDLTSNTITHILEKDLRFTDTHPNAEREANIQKLLIKLDSPNGLAIYKFNDNKRLLDEVRRYITHFYLVIVVFHLQTYVGWTVLPLVLPSLVVCSE